MPGKLKQLRVLAFAVGCGVIVLSAFLCGCDSHQNNDDDAGRDAASDYNADDAEAFFRAAVRYQKKKRHADALAAYKKAIAIERGAGEVARAAREFIRKLPKQ